MSRLRITDNHPDVDVRQESNDRYSHDEIDDNVIRDLQCIANVKIGKLHENSGNLLFFPHELGYYGDDIGEGRIISLNNDSIATGNIMGFVGVNNTQIDIVSRFARNGEDYFLHYMLQKVFAINLFDIKHASSDQPIFDFLMYLFPYFLKKALAQGIFKKYRRFEYNDSTVRGAIDVNRHIRENIPFKGTVAYSTRKHSYDNEVTELVRHTIEYIKTKKMGAAILNSDSEMKSFVSQIIQATPTYNIRNSQKVFNQNIRPVRHPYFTEYTALQKICLQILRHESIKYGQEKDKIYGILFDGAWLWEEYLDTIFKRMNVSITHAKNKTGENGISLYKGGKECYYPDFYKRLTNDKDGSHSFVLDAKYKRLGFGVPVDQQGEKDTLNHISISRDDLFQMITYMHVLPAKRCALVYPLDVNETHAFDVTVSKPRLLNGFGGELFGYGIPIAQEDVYDKFCEKQLRIEEQLRKMVSCLAG